MIAGAKYKYDGSNPFLIGNYCLWNTVIVVHDDGENIHYREEGTSLVKQTPKDRFLEIAIPYNGE